MKRRLISVAIFLFAVAVPHAFANSIASETTSGSSGLSEGITYDFDTERAGEGTGHWEGSAEYVYANSSSTDPLTGNAITDQSNTFDFSFGYHDRFQAGAGLTYGTTPAEALKDFGPSVYAGYTFQFGAPSPAKPKPQAVSKPATKQADSDSDDEDQDDGEDFRPALTVKATAGTTTYTASLNAARLARTVEVGLKQSSLELRLDADLLEWLSLGASATRYSYDRDVAFFVSRLDSPLAVRAGASGFADALSGFNTRSWSLDATVRPQATWSITAEYDNAVSAIDGSTAPGEKLTLSKDLGTRWTIGVGAEHSESLGDVSNSGILNVSYSI